MVQVHHLLKLADPDPRQIRLQDQYSLPHNLSKVVTAATPAIFNKDMVFMVARLAASMLVSVELEPTKQPGKVTRAANNMAATKPSVEIIMAIANSVVDGVETMDTN
jgi:hypothetical protein